MEQDFFNEAANFSHLVNISDIFSNNSTEATSNEEELESSTIKEKEEKDDELGPILPTATPFRARCYTWPRQYLEDSQEPLSSPDSSASCTMSPQHQVQQSSTDFLPQVSEGPEEPSQTPGEIKAETFVACGSPKQKNSSRRNAWGNLSYADLITQAIKSAPEQRLTLSQIYEWVVKNVPYFKDKGDSASSSGWKNSIRHNLSLHSRFKRVQNEGQGKSSWWMMNPEAAVGASTNNSNSASNTNRNATDRNPSGNSKHCLHQHHHHHPHHYRKRSNTLESASRLIEKRRPTNAIKRRDSLGSIRSLTPSTRRDLQRTASSGSLSYPESPEFTTVRPRTLSNASSCGGRMSPMALSMPPSTIETSPPVQQQWHVPQRPHSPIFNYIEKLQISNSLDDDLEDINNLIDSDVGVQNLPQQNDFENCQLMAQIQQHQQDMNYKLKILEPRFKPIQMEEQGFAQQPVAAQKQILKLRSDETWMPPQQPQLESSSSILEGILNSNKQPQFTAENKLLCASGTTRSPAAAPPTTISLGSLL